jgi:hypothetical protein
MLLDECQGVPHGSLVRSSHPPEGPFEGLTALVEGAAIAAAE